MFGMNEVLYVWCVIMTLWNILIKPQTNFYSSPEWLFIRDKQYMMDRNMNIYHNG